ncbi:MAG: hypothetical protein JSU86_15590 [Phycisphaerales bacterium]|nr:MAG: hypothetical protein JSU86_15590 [Phycisphaerales bacterium]
MDETNLFAVCAAALLAVFILLGLLAAVIRLMAVLLPSRDRPCDAALVAALGSAAMTVYPGARVTKIEEVL